MARLVLSNTESCPFCGCQKIFLKAVTVQWSDFDPVTRKWSSGYRIKAAGQCAKCHIRGPFVYSEPKEHRQDPDDELIAKVVERWNERH